MRRMTGIEWGRVGRSSLVIAFAFALLCPPSAEIAWAEGGCSIDPLRVPSWAHAPKLDRPAPFAARYEGCGKRLIYVAAAHTNDPRSSTFHLIERVFGIAAPQVVLVEGVEVRGGLNPGGNQPNGLRETARDAEGSVRDSEALLAARL